VPALEAGDPDLLAAGDLVDVAGEDVEFRPNVGHVGDGEEWRVGRHVADIGVAGEDDARDGGLDRVGLQAVVALDRRQHVPGIHRLPLALPDLADRARKAGLDLGHRVLVQVDAPGECDGLGDRFAARGLDLDTRGPGGLHVDDRAVRLALAVVLVLFARGDYVLGRSGPQGPIAQAGESHDGYEQYSLIGHSMPLRWLVSARCG